MAGTITTLITDVRAAMAATWADVKPDGIWLFEQLESIPWEDVTPPYAAILCSQGVKVEWGADKFAMVFAVQMVRVASVSAGIEVLIDDIELLWRNLIDTRIGHHTMLSFESLDWGDEIPGNEIFIAKNYRHRAARLIMNVLVGYVPG